MSQFLQADDQDDDKGASLRSKYSQATLLAALPSRQGLIADDDDDILNTLRPRSQTHLRSPSSDDLDNTSDDEAELQCRLDKVRSLASTIDVKRKARAQLLATPRARLEGFDKWKYERGKEWERAQRSFKAFLNLFNIWTKSLKTIEGSFGSSVVSYFQFIKWLFLLNIFTFMCVLGGIILPQAVFSPHEFEDTIYSNNTSVLIPAGQQMAVDCSSSYAFSVANATGTSVDSLIIDVFQGTGMVENTYVFIGFYFNKTRFYDYSKTYYDMSLAYLLVTGGYLCVTLILMVRYTAQGVKEKLLNKGNKFTRASCLVFCGWDHNLNEKNAAMYKHVNLEREIVSELSAQKRAELRLEMGKTKKIIMYTKRIIINLVSVASLIGSATLIYFVVQIWKPTLLEQDKVISSDALSLAVEYLPSATITILNFVLPFIFTKLVVFEDYSPAVELKINISRMASLRLASLVILAFTMLQVVSCRDDDMVCGSCKSLCWETYVGQELYKLVIMDVVVLYITTFLVDFPRKALVDKVKKLRGFQQEFDLPKNVLDIVYTQTLSWWGGFHSPIIPAITVFKLFSLFYCKKLSLLMNQKPPSRSYRASNASHFFMVVLMLSFTMSVMAIMYPVGRMTPSQSCSPFRVHMTSEYRMFNAIPAAVRTLPQIAQNIFYFLSSWICYIIIFFILTLSIYYQVARSAGSERVAELLEEQLLQAEKDKQYLLSQVNQALQ